MKTTLLIIWALLLAVPVCAEDERPELLLGLSTDSAAGQVVFEVASSGCTAKEDFRCEFKENTLTIFRIRRDACKAMPQKTSIAFTLEELGIPPHQPFVLGNRITVNEMLSIL